jgi:hypothetical protein
VREYLLVSKRKVRDYEEIEERYKDKKNNEIIDMSESVLGTGNILPTVFTPSSTLAHLNFAFRA